MGQMILDSLFGDTFCIDKSSSAELQEAITSMFRWYGRVDCTIIGFRLSPN